MPRSFYARYAPLIIVIVALLLPVTLTAALVALQSNRNDVKEWLPESFEETRDYKEFQRNFENDTFVLVSWEGCTLEDPRLERFAADIAQRRPEGERSQPYFAEVVTGPSVVQQLVQAPTNLSYEKAIRRLKGSLVGPDGKQTCAVLTLSAEGDRHLHPAIDAVYAAAAAAGIKRSALRMGGPPVDNVAIDMEGERMLVTLMALSAVVGLGLAWWFLRNVVLTAMVFIGGVYSAALSLALVYFSGGTMNSILLTMPSVVYTSGLACAIHIINYYRHTRAQAGVEGSPERGVKLAWLPCLLSAGTTSLGLISLYTSELIPIKMFGLYSAIGVMSTIALMFLYLPSALQLWPSALPELDTTPEDQPSLLDAVHRRRMRWLGSTIIARPTIVWWIFMIALVVLGSGLHRARTTVNLMSLFSPRAEIIHYYRWLEDKLGPLVPMEVVVDIDPKTTNMTFLERFELVDQLQEQIELIDAVGSTMSAVTFAPEFAPRGRLLGRSTWRMVLNKSLLDHRQEFLGGDYLAIDRKTGHELWRINVRVAALRDIDYGEFIHDIRGKVDPVLKRARDSGIRGIGKVTYTGLTPVVYRAERALLDGLVESFVVAFFLIAGMMSIVFRSIWAGLYTMLPNVWPVVVVFGAMSWMGFALDIGTMMTASVAMGVCVDDTVHFATWFRRATQSGLPRRKAVVRAYENSAGAIYQSTVIVALGLVTFAISDFMPTRRFGLLMFTLLLSGLVSDLVLTPAMLAGFIGKYFSVAVARTPRKRANKRRESPDPAAHREES